MQLNDLLVLYVSENKDDFHEIEFLLSKNVDRVIFATTVKESICQYRIFSPCIIIVQSEFQDSKLVSFLQEIRKDDIKTAFIVISGNTGNAYICDLMELYLTKYIIKPYLEEVLIDALTKCLDIIEKRIYSNVKLSERISFNFQTQSIIKDNETYTLNKKESLLINLLIRNPDRIVTYEEIEYHIWNNEVSKAAFKSLIRDLRKKTFKELITNVSGIGYRLNVFFSKNEILDVKGQL